LAALFALAWLIGRRRLAPTRAVSADERLAGLTVAVALLCAVAVALAIAKPYALVFVLPSLYAWPWIRVDRTAWHGLLLFLTGLAGPILGLALLADQVGISFASALLYTSGLVTVGYISLGSVLVTIAWAAAGAQFAAIALGRYAPYAAGAQPPPEGPLARAGRRVLAKLSRG
jgi:hypothetical protein